MDLLGGLLSAVGDLLTGLLGILLGGLPLPVDPGHLPIPSLPGLPVPGLPIPSLPDLPVPGLPLPSLPVPGLPDLPVPGLPSLPPLPGAPPA